MLYFKDVTNVTITSIDPSNYSGLADDDFTTTILAPLVDRARERQNSVIQEMEMADIIHQVTATCL